MIKLCGAQFSLDLLKVPDDAGPIGAGADTLRVGMVDSDKGYHALVLFQGLPELLLSREDIPYTHLSKEKNWESVKQLCSLESITT